MIPAPMNTLPCGVGMVTPEVCHCALQRPSAATCTCSRFERWLIGTFDQYQYRERAAFAISAAVLLTCLRESPDMVRGVFGRIGRSIVN